MSLPVNHYAGLYYTVETSTSPHYVTQLHISLPVWLTPAVWLRYHYTLNDVMKTLGYFRIDLLYQLALLLGIHPSHSAIKADPQRVPLKFSSKAIILTKVKQQINVLYPSIQKQTRSVLDTQRLQHIPALPCVFIPSKQFCEVITWIPDDLNLLTSGTWPRAFPYKDIFLVPFSIEKQALYAVRVVLESDYQATQRPTDSLVTRPVPVILRSRPEEQWVATEEACFLLPLSAKRKRKELC